MLLKSIFNSHPFTFHQEYSRISFLIHPPELSGNYQQRYLIAKQKKFGEEMASELFLESIS
jgi:hypothetical protein